MAVVHLDGATIVDNNTFHAACKTAFGFPDFYGCTMEAWVDCLSYLRDEENMTTFLLKPDEKLQILVKDAEMLRQHAPDLLEELAYCIAGINDRYADYGEKPALELKLA